MPNECPSMEAAILENCITTVTSGLSQHDQKVVPLWLCRKSELFAEIIP